MTQDAAPPADPLGRPPDAIVYPQGMFQGTVGDRVRSLQDAFREVMGGRRLHASNQGIYGFASTVPSHTGRELLFPAGHPLERQERYIWLVGHRVGPGRWSFGRPVESWRDEPEAVKFGWLRPDQDGSGLEEQIYASGRAAAARDDTPAAHRARIDRLRAAGLVRADEADHPIARPGRAEDTESHGERTGRAD
jgi:hypothetical protein